MLKRWWWVVVLALAAFGIFWWIVASPGHEEFRFTRGARPIEERLIHPGRGVVFRRMYSLRASYPEVLAAARQELAGAGFKETHQSAVIAVFDRGDGSSVMLHKDRRMSSFRGSVQAELKTGWVSVMVMTPVRDRTIWDEVVRWLGL